MRIHAAFSRKYLEKLALATVTISIIYGYKQYTYMKMKYRKHTYSADFVAIKWLQTATGPQCTYGISPAAHVLFAPRLHVHAFALEAQDLIHDCIVVLEEQKAVCIRNVSTQKLRPKEMRQW